MQWMEKEEKLQRCFAVNKEWTFHIMKSLCHLCVLYIKHIWIITVFIYNVLMMFFLCFYLPRETTKEALLSTKDGPSIIKYLFVFFLFITLCANKLLNYFYDDIKYLIKTLTAWNWVSCIVNISQKVFLLQSCRLRALGPPEAGCLDIWNCVRGDSKLNYLLNGSEIYMLTFACINSLKSV